MTKLQIVAGFVGGVVLGIFFHYLLYRITLPSEPFIYFSF
jgi:hypothetical protein